MFVKRWKKLEHKDRLRWVAVGALLVFGIYGLVFYPISNAKLEHAQNMVNRKLDRIKKRAAVPRVKEDGPSDRMLKRQFGEIQKQVGAAQEALDKLRLRMLLADDQEAQERLLLSISALARKTGLRITRQGGDAMSSKMDRTPIIQKDRISGRPTYKLQALGSFWQLQDFLGQLQEMPVVSAPVHFQIAVFNPLDKSGRKEKLPERIQGDLLEIDLTLTL